MSKLKICVQGFSGTIEASILKLGIRMDTMGLRNVLIVFTFFRLFVHLSVFLVNLCRKFFQELRTLQSSNVVYIMRMSDCIVGLRLRLMALILPFFSIFLSFPIFHVNIENLCHMRFKTWYILGQ